MQTVKKGNVTLLFESPSTRNLKLSCKSQNRALASVVCTPSPSYTVIQCGVLHITALRGQPRRGSRKDGEPQRGVLPDLIHQCGRRRDLRDDLLRQRPAPLPTGSCSPGPLGGSHPRLDRTAARRSVSLRQGRGRNPTPQVILTTVLYFEDIWDPEEPDFDDSCIL